ncbi:MAG: S41 family peptidase, partial [Phycisphaerales bacterium JB064]
LLSSLTAPRHAYTIPRGANPDDVPEDAYPRDRRVIYGYSKPIAVLCNENSYSNAEIFSHAIKTTGRGTLVGQETYGAVISTGSYRLIDGTTVRRPFRGWYLPDGTDMENNGAVPDVLVLTRPGDEAEGVDRQLEAAVKAVVEDLD